MSKIGTETFFKRVLVKKDEHRTEPKFGECLLNTISHDEFVQIEVEETDDDIIISSKKNGLPLLHAPGCPLRKDFDRKLLPKSRIHLAVAGLIENVDTGEIMITKRPKHMRTF